MFGKEKMETSEKSGGLFGDPRFLGETSVAILRIFLLFIAKGAIPMRYSAGGAMLQCPCCGHDRFDLDFRQLNTTGLSFFGLDWANKNAAILVCQRCSYISWFMNEPQEEK